MVSHLLITFITPGWFEEIPQILPECLLFLPASNVWLASLSSVPTLKRFCRNHLGVNRLRLALLCFACFSSYRDIGGRYRQLRRIRFASMYRLRPVRLAGCIFSMDNPPSTR